MLNTILTALCFLLILCAIVVVHEGGHTLVARLMGMRVTEFYIGMPYGPEKSFVSRRSGIRYGVTLALLGGYTRICGMSVVKDDRLALVLALFCARGRVCVAELEKALRCDEAQAQALIDTLVDLGSVEPVFEAGRRRRRKEKPVAYATVARDAAGLTARDRGNSLVHGAAHEAGAPFDPGMSPEDFLASEMSHTYVGKTFLRRAFVLVAGVLFNLLFAFVVLTGCYATMHEQHFVLDVDDVVAGSPADEAGIQAGCEIYSIDGRAVEGFTQVSQISEAFSASDAVVLKYGGPGEEGAEGAHTVTLHKGQTGGLGLSMNVSLADSPETVALPDAARASVAYIGTVATSVLSLLNPNEAPEVLSQSSGVVGIAQMTSQAVSTGFFDIVVLLAALSVSLGWMNLLPIPPLDGGKLLIEVVERLIGREVPLWVEGALSLVGIAAVLALFFFMVFQDLGRIF